MARREYDIVLYGASGFTARYVTRELEKSHLRIALAARSAAKIPSTSLPKIECPIDTLATLTARTRLLINMVGPYAFTGSEVILACISTSTHYLDICGEVQFLRNVLRTFGEDAKRSGVTIVQSCGFDSVPADIGTMFLSRYFDHLSIDSTVCVWNSRINRGTWLSLLNSLKESGKKKGRKSDNSTVSTRAKTYRYNDRTSSYDVSFRSSDSYVVRRSTEHLQQSIRYVSYINVGSIFSLIAYFIFGFLVTSLAKYTVFYSFLVNHPRLCSFGMVRENGPSHQEVCSSRFEMVLNGTGCKDQKAVRKSLKIVGPDPGYISTSMFVTECAYLLLENEDKIESGVLTPAQAYRKTDIVERLDGRGICFQVRDGSCF